MNKKAMDLEIEKLRSNADGIYVTHTRSKQRSDKRSSVFLVPRAKDVNEIDYAKTVDLYISSIKDQLGKFKGRLFYTGRNLQFVDSPMGKNSVAGVPKEMASFLEKDNSDAFMFHSLRRSSATAAADSGATAQQLTDFYGWKNPNMPQVLLVLTHFIVYCSMISQNLRLSAKKII